ncbi:unnamed protein product [Ectocarpus sp. 13 AM-2016]
MSKWVMLAPKHVAFSTPPSVQFGWQRDRHMLSVIPHQPTPHFPRFSVPWVFPGAGDNGSCTIHAGSSASTSARRRDSPNDRCGVKRRRSALSSCCTNLPPSLTRQTSANSRNLGTGTASTTNQGLIHLPLAAISRPSNDLPGSRLPPVVPASPAQLWDVFATSTFLTEQSIAQSVVDATSPVPATAAPATFLDMELGINLNAV